MSLALILGDQLTPSLLDGLDPAATVVVMAEVGDEATYVRHHPQKIALILAAMRHHAEALREAGWTVAYTRLDDPENSQSIPGELLRRAADTGATEVHAVPPGDWRLREALNDMPLPVRWRPDPRFLCGLDEFAAWAEGRSVLRMELFYREMRRRTGYLMDGDTPVGGRWNYDAENRGRAEPDLLRPKPPAFAPDPVTTGVLDLVRDRFGGHFGTLDGFAWPVTRDEALLALDAFVRDRLPRFGETQDAMLTGDWALNHALLSSSMNLGLLTAAEVCDAAQAAFNRGEVPLASAEGFIRQILGWREFIRGVWHHEGPGYLAQNALGADRPVPGMYWGAPTRMACMASAIGQTRDRAYAHHIQRLMVTGNFALLAGLDPAAVQAWYLEVYIDAYEWVEAPNVVGMALFADGGRFASKPYAASGAYIDRMSDHCRGCAYDVRAKAGEGACPFNRLYWDFVGRHAARFRGHPRMGQIVRTWDKFGPARQEAIRADAAALVARLDSGEVV